VEIEATDITLQVRCEMENERSQSETSTSGSSGCSGADARQTDKASAVSDRSSDGLLPCHFCGGVYVRIQKCSGWYSVVCDGCGAQRALRTLLYSQSPRQNAAFRVQGVMAESLRSKKVVGIS